MCVLTAGWWTVSILLCILRRVSDMDALFPGSSSLFSQHPSDLFSLTAGSKNGRERDAWRHLPDRRGSTETPFVIIIEVVTDCCLSTGSCEGAKY